MPASGIDVNSCQGRRLLASCFYISLRRLGGNSDQFLELGVLEEDIFKGVGMTLAAEAKAKLVQGAFKVMQSRLFVGLLQDKRVLGFLVDGMSLRVRMKDLLRESGVAAAHALGLATLEDLRALEGDVLKPVRFENQENVGFPRERPVVDETNAQEGVIP